jgi:hypothetical protein
MRLFNDRKTGKQVALKIVKSEKHYMEAAQDEIILLKTIADKDPNNTKCCVQLVDSFEISGPHGKRKYIRSTNYNYIFIASVSNRHFLNNDDFSRSRSRPRNCVLIINIGLF